VEYAAHMGEMRNEYKILVGKCEGKRQLRRLICRWEETIMDLRGIGLEVVDWVHVAQNRVHWQALVIMVMNFQVT
jgi:hypothetical protein